MKAVVIGACTRAVCLLRPLFAARISAGFPSPAEDWIEGRLDLNRHLIRHPASTFYIRVVGDSMSERIKDGDILVVDRACEVVEGDIAIIRVGDDFTVKKIGFQDGKLLLIPENETYEPIVITEEMDFEVWGKVLWSIRAH